MASLAQLSRDRDTAARQRGQLLACLKRAGVEISDGEDIEVQGGSIYALDAREWQKGGLIGGLRGRRYLGEIEDAIDGLRDANGILCGLSFSQPAGLGSIDEDNGHSVVFCILPACSPAESIRSTPRRPGAPSRSGC